MAIDNFTVEIVDAPIHIYLGEDIFSSNIGSDSLNLNISDETIKLSRFEEIFKSSIDGFLGSNDAAVLASYFIFNEIPNGLINNLNIIYTLLNLPITGTVVVFLNGLLQAPNLDYIISGDTITFFKPLKINMDLYVSYIRNN